MPGATLYTRRVVQNPANLGFEQEVHSERGRTLGGARSRFPIQPKKTSTLAQWYCSLAFKGRTNAKKFCPRLVELVIINLRVDLIQPLSASGTVKQNKAKGQFTLQSQAIHMTPRK